MGDLSVFLIDVVVLLVAGIDSHGAAEQVDCGSFRPDNIRRIIRRWQS